MTALTDDHARSLVDRGFLLVPGFLSGDELAAARADMLRYFPTADELAAAPNRYPWIFEDPDHLQVEFPFAADTLNFVSTHPRLIAFVERLLGTREILLSQSAVWAKYAGVGSYEQTMHLDYEGNTLVVPRDDGRYRQVNMILYCSDVPAELGPTHVVPRDRVPDAGLWPPFRPRRKYPELYRHEIPVIASAGDLLLFGMSTFHRAGEITAETGARFSHHMVWKSADCPFNGYHQYSQFGERPEMRRFLTAATPRQRETVGFPAPGHPYWTPATLAAVAERYPKMDLTPYRAALNRD